LRVPQRKGRVPSVSIVWIGTHKEGMCRLQNVAL
jgi:hypothetical protein